MTNDCKGCYANTRTSGDCKILQEFPLRRKECACQRCIVKVTCKENSCERYEEHYDKISNK